jgi:two-component system response regulator GlrR
LMEEIHSIMPEMPIIIFTAHGTNETEAEAMRKGAHSYLTKPFEPRDLLWQIEKALAGRR